MLRINPGLGRARLLVIPTCLALTALATMGAPVPAAAQVGIDISVTTAPPPLPEYDQPPLPGDGYIWTPGYWAYGDYGYYWVPGTWVQPPTVGLLWTPGYWGFNGGRYIFNAGYWGPQVGFYGGIDYGFGYTGLGYEGGFWRSGVFSYNRAVNNFGGAHITNVYNKTVVNNVTVNRVSYNGPGGVTRQPTPQEQSYAHEHHVQPTAEQVQQRTLAAKSPDLRESVNHGRPAITATRRPGDFPRTAAVDHATPRAERPAAESARPGEAARPAAEHGAEHAPAATATRERPAENHTVERTQATHAPERDVRSATHPAARPEEARPEHAATERARPEEARPERAATERERPMGEPAAARRPEPARAEAPRPAAPHPEAAHPESHDDKPHR
jgi:hypothetical protein